MTGGLSQRGHLSPPTIFLTMWLWHSSSEKWVQCNKCCSPWIWQAPVTGTSKARSQQTTQLLLVSLEMLTLRNQPPPCCEDVQINLCGETGVSVFWGTAKIHQTWAKKPPASRSQQQVSASFQLFLAKAQTRHPHTADLNSDRTPSLIKRSFTSLSEELATWQKLTRKSTLS